MKNISRRVFIKGMAVAAVATAASTVLAGCNVPGTTTEAPVAGFKPESKTLTFGENSVRIDTTNFVTTYDEKLKVSLKIVNDMDNKVGFFNADTIGDLTSDYEHINAVAYFDGEYMGHAFSLRDGDCDKWMAANTDVSGVATNYTYEGALYFNEPDEWTTMTLVFTMNGKDEDGKASMKEVKFVFNK